MVGSWGQESKAKAAARDESVWKADEIQPLSKKEQTSFFL